MEHQHREKFENLVQKQEEERKDLIDEAHGEALEENAEIDNHEVNTQELKDEKEAARNPVEKSRTISDAGFLEDGEAVKKVKKNERIPIDNVKAHLVNFLEDMMGSWTSTEEKIKGKGRFIFQKPNSESWEFLRNNIYKAGFGECSLNPDTISINWDLVSPEEIKAVDIKKMEDRPLSEVAEYLVATYGATHYIPGIEYMEYLLENPNKIPESLKGNKNSYFFGSTIRGLDGAVYVPFLISYDDGKTSYGHYWLQNRPYSSSGENCCVILEK